MSTQSNAPRAGGAQVIPRPLAWRTGAVPSWVVDPGLGAVAVAARVRDAALADQVEPPTFPDARPSAVLVALVDAPSGPEVLLTKRSTRLRNHAGEISFPGGRIDGTESSEQAALREAHEEVGLDPVLASVVGQLSSMSTVVSRSHIVPVVAVLDERPPLSPHVHEVERILWVPLAELADAATYHEEWWGTPPLDRRMDFFQLADETVWGATARMLHELLTVAYGPPATRTAAK